jgi:hypothetical protein
MEVILAIAISIVANVISHIICNWIDDRKK